MKIGSFFHFFKMLTVWLVKLGTKGKRMKVKIVRAFESDAVTMGMLTIEGVEHDPIYTLENPLRETTKDSRIPSGTYQAKPHGGPGMKYQDVWCLQDVPGRTGILIHNGVHEGHTEGCILVGFGAGLFGDEEVPAVFQSRKALDFLRYTIGINNEFEVEIV